MINIYDNCNNTDSDMTCKPVFNGLLYEKTTHINNHLSPVSIQKFGPGKNDYYEEYIINYQQIFRLEKNGLKKFLFDYCNSYYEKRNIQPDEAFVNREKKIIYILEKKFQKCYGSADEKIQTGPFKLQYYKKLYPEYKVKFSYILSDWFKKDKYKLERQFLKENNIDILWGDNKYYFKNLISWLK